MSQWLQVLNRMQVNDDCDPSHAQVFDGSDLRVTESTILNCAGTA